MSSHNSQQLFTKMWHEFLFTREFEYETPLPPSEIATAFTQLEKEHSWWLRTDKLKHHVEYNPSGDKGGEFKISLLSQWGNNLEIQSTKGKLTTDPATGITIIKGYTRFSSYYYILALSIFLFNMFIQTVAGIWILFWLSFAMIPLVWYLLYHERNKLADRIDNIIMNAKSDHSAEHLSDEMVDTEFDFEEQVEKGYLSSEGIL